MRAQLTSSLGGSHRNSEVSPQKKREREELRGARGHPSAQKPSPPPEVGRAVSSLGEPEQSQDGLSSRTAFRFWSGTRSPRPPEVFGSCAHVRSRGAECRVRGTL